MSSLFGGSKSTQTSSSQSNSESYNKAYPQLSNAFSPVLDYTSQSGNAIQKLLSGDTSGLNAYKDATGYDWQSGQGAASVVAGNAVKGLRDSGSTLKSLANYQSNLDNQYSSNYLSQLFNLANLGVSAGNSISGAGNYSNASSSSQGQSESTQSGGIGGALGGLLSNASLFKSDRRAKKDIVKLGEREDGLGVYEWTYIWEKDERHIGVMADEVAELLPHALGPIVDGYQTVNYGAL